MKIPNIFRIGNADDKKTAKTLGANLSALFGAKEGESLQVEASESGVSAIDAAEIKLTSIEKTLTEAQASVKEANKQLEESVTKITTLEAKITEKDAKIAELGNAPASNHTKPRSGDTVTGDEGGNELSDYQKVYQAKIAEAKENATSKPD